MTAVAVQQHGGDRQQYNPRQSRHSSNMSSPHQSRPQSYTPSVAPQLQRQEPPIQNSTSAAVSPRPAVSNDPVHTPNGHGRSPANGDHRSSISTNGGPPNVSDAARERRASLQARPASAPNNGGDTSQDEEERAIVKRRPNPILLRSKSDYGPRGDDSPVEEEIQDWGARHGFEDHYASEEYVSQLANVGCTFHFSHDLYLLGQCIFWISPYLAAFWLSHSWSTLGYIASCLGRT